jgi:hypothetical protein
MATDIDEALRRLQDMLAAATATGDSAKIKTLNTAIDIMEASLKTASERTKNYAKELELSTRTAKSERQARSALDDDIKKQTKSIREQAKTNKDAKEELQKYIDSLTSAVGDETLKKSIESQIKGNYRAARAQEGLNAAQETMSKAASVAAKPLAAVGSVFSAYQSGSSQIGTASAVLQSGMELGGSAAEGLGKIATTAGAAIMPLGPIGLIAGTAISGAGIAAQIFGKGLSEAASKVLPKFSAEVEKNIAAFQSMSSSGALFAGGVGEMITVSGEAGLTLDQMSKVVKTNSSALADSAVGIGNATKLMGAAIKAGGDPMKKQMLNLGFTIEEQAGLVADTMGIMGRAGRDLSKISGGEIAKATQDYALNLRTIASITGEDAKKIQERAKQQMANMGIQATIEERRRAGDENAEARFTATTQIATAAGETVSNATRQLLGQGQLMGDTARQFALLGPAGEEFQQTILRIRNDKSLSSEESTKLTNDALASLKDGVRNNPELMRQLSTATEAGVSSLATFATGLQSVVTGTTPFSKNFDAVAEAARKQAETTDKQTQAMTDMINENQKLNVEIQNLVVSSGGLTSYMNYAKDAAKLFTEALEEIVDKFGKPRETAQTTQTPFVPGLNDNDIKPSDRQAQIDLRKKELEEQTASLAKNPSRKGAIGNTRENRIKKLNEEIEALTKAQSVDAAGTPVIGTPTPEAPVAAPVTPVAPVAPVDDLSKLSPDEISNRMKGMTGAQRAKFRSQVDEAKIKASAQPKAPGSAALATPVASTIAPASANSLPTNPADLVSLGQASAAGGSSLATFATDRLSVDKSNSTTLDIQKLLESNQQLILAMQESNQYNREIAANTKKTVEVMQ